MKYKTHVIGGVCSAVILNQFILQPNTIEANIIPCTIVMAGSIVGSLLPDIDHTQSYLGKRAKIISKPMNSLLGHRGAFHSPFLHFLILSLLFIVGQMSLSDGLFVLHKYLLSGLAIGIFSHLFLDSLTKAGIPILYPVSKKKVSFMPLTTGGKGEFVVRILLYLTIINNVVLFFK